MAEAQPVHTARGGATEVELTRGQQVAARRAAESRATIPDITLELLVDLGSALARGLDPDDLLIAACARALREHPRLNATYRDARVLCHERVNIAVAVATDDGVALPTLFDADAHDLGAIAARRAAIAAGARAGSLEPPAFAGGTFTVHGPSLCAVDRVRVLVEPGQVAVLAAGAVRERPAPSAWCTLTVDRRALDAAQAGRFLARVGELLDQPALLS
ncbi:MAG TPA: 2-oxo acid dehydrogenase subunit E2 [Solirubrobacteraceae bacterium]|jgi:pyruvate dehydrogenase E2 component (dihydrolipoamide acetyltransferase)|nr:2-oxo acid dehydrogenase subunit E2 [Solirubrobacteraceae bacterium]